MKRDPGPLQYRSYSPGLDPEHLSFSLLTGAHGRFVVLLGSREENAGTKRIPDAVLSLFPWAQRYAFIHSPGAQATITSVFGSLPWSLPSSASDHTAAVRLTVLR